MVAKTVLKWIAGIWDTGAMPTPKNAPQIVFNGSGCPPCAKMLQYAAGKAHPATAGTLAAFRHNTLGDVPPILLLGATAWNCVTTLKRRLLLDEAIDYFSAKRYPVAYLAAFLPYSKVPACILLSVLMKAKPPCCGPVLCPGRLI